ncbi:MAG: YfhO family protein [Bacilli bacterium]|nr:YfhO family protein [Bacilli bacterium]
MENVTETNSLKSKIKEKLSYFKKLDNFFYYVLALIGTGLLFFGWALVTEKFTTPYGGDFSQQTYQAYFNIYDDWWTFFKTGKFPFYDTNTYLGVDNIASNTYYGLFTPFTFIILFFPRTLIPQAMALVSVTRLVVGGLFFRMYLKYMGASERTARLFSFSYAFIGWMAYNLWFNQFYEVLTFFPLVLMGIEKVLKEQKLWLLSLGYFLLGISNYFFLLSLGIYGVVYAGFRYFQTLKTRSLKDNLFVLLYGFLGFLFGMGASMFCVFPSLYAGFAINRSNNAKYFDMLRSYWNYHDYKNFFKVIFKCWNASIVNYGDTYGKYYFSYYMPYISYFIPPVSGRYVTTIKYHYFENTACSMFIYTPNIILMGGAIYRSIKNKKISHFIAFAGLFIALFIPFFYFLSGAFVTAYGRWELIVAVAALTYVALNYDYKDEVPWFIILISGVLALINMIVVYFVSLKVDEMYDLVSAMEDRVGIVIYEIALCAVETGLFAGLWKKKYLTTIINFLVAGEVAVVGTFIAFYHGLSNIDNRVGGGFTNVKFETQLISNISKDDPSYYRIQFTRAYDGNNNLGMLENYNGTSTFHSFYNNNLDDFIHYSQMMNSDSSWTGNNFSKRANLDEFLGVKYYVTSDEETTFKRFNEDGNYINSVFYEPNVPLNYERIDDDDDGYRVYKNKYHIDFATSYSDIYYKKDCDDIYDNFYPTYSSTSYVLRNEEAYFKGAILDDVDVEEIKRNYEEEFTYLDMPPSRDAKFFSTYLKGVYKNPDNQYFDPVNPYRDIKNENLVEGIQENGKGLQIVFAPTYGDFPYSDEGIYFAFNYPIKGFDDYNYDSTLFLVNTDDEVITYDYYQHPARNSHHSIRGIYTKEHVKYFIFVPNGKDYETYMTLYYEPFEDCIARYQNAIDNGVQDVTYDVNKFTFKTNYETSRFVVTQLTYTGGWKVTAIDESGNKTNLKVYNAQGGFSGFVAPKGNVSYVMTYEAPNFKWGVLMSVFSVTGVALGTAIPLIVKRKKKED